MRTKYKKIEEIFHIMKVTSLSVKLRFENYVEVFLIKSDLNHTTGDSKKRYLSLYISNYEDILNYSRL